MVAEPEAAGDRYESCRRADPHLAAALTARSMRPAVDERCVSTWPARCRPLRREYSGDARSAPAAATSQRPAPDEVEEYAVSARGGVILAWSCHPSGAFAPAWR